MDGEFEDESSELDFYDRDAEYDWDVSTTEGQKEALRRLIDEENHPRPDETE